MRSFLILTALLSCLTGVNAWADEEGGSSSFSIDRARYRDGRVEVRVIVNRRDTARVENAYDANQVLARSTRRSSNTWDIRVRANPVPCRVKAVDETTGETAELDVSNAPSTCSPKAPAQQVCSISVNPTSLAFGSVNVGSSASRSTTVTNTGTASCALTVARSGTNEFALTSATSINIAVGGNATVSASYTPNAAGADTGNLAISGSGITTVNVPITGTGVAVQQQVCSISVNPTSLAFGSVNVGSSASRSTTVTNTGTASCALTVARSGTSEFALTSATSLNIAVGGNATVSASYTPNAAGADTGNLAISGSGITTVNVPMTGTGVAVQQQVCSISVNPTSLAFGSVNVGSSASRSTTVTNTGTASCALTVARSGTNEFALTSGASINIAVGGNATVSASYTPNGAGADTGNLAISGSGITTVNVPMSGTGVQQQVQCNPTNLNRSINSTSVDGCPDANVPQVAQVLTSTTKVLAINDLGMHCGDLDTRVASILPPFQVLLAQVIQQGASPTLNPAGVSVFYSATQNPNDPILGSNVFDGVNADGTTYKTNFWDFPLVGGTYDPFYPAFDPFNPAQNITPLAGPPFNIDADTGLPVPNAEDLYIGPDGRVNSGDEFLSAVVHAMPGIAAPYTANAPKRAEEHYTDKPFFVNFPFGYVAADVNWYEGAGVPFAAFDDNGREAPYPLVRVEAKNAAGTTLSTVDTVLPISGEASCVNCHAQPADLTSVTGRASRSSSPTNALNAAGLPVVLSIQDPDGNMPERVSLEYASDINTLRLHDLKHGAAYVAPSAADDGTTVPAPCEINAANPNGNANCLTNKALDQGVPVVCQVCHYTPALDLAHLGPLTGPVGSIANGRNQLSHSSNSNVMHSHHAGTGLFPAIPAPIQAANGTITNQAQRLDALENSCYQCHPGTNVQCLRGAMFNGDMLCSDCHGTMEQVGADFSQNVSPTNPGAFVLDQGNFYDAASSQPRTPWANEPGCGSCHTGDASSNLAGGTNVVRNNVDSNGNDDNIRLRVAFRTTNNPKAVPIVPTNKRFAEPAVPASFNGFANPGAGNPQLYRVSTGHGGVMCEGCHGATHAEWPNANPNSNDNTTSTQLQGHAGVIADCTTCHGTANPGNNLNGPHGLHRIAYNSTPWSSSSVHEGPGDNFGNCATCHGGTSRNNSCGTVLSRALAQRTFSGRTVRAGEPVGCAVCHSGTTWNNTCVPQHNR